MPSHPQTRLLTSASPGLGTVPGKEVELTGICPVPCPSRYWFRATSTLVRLSQPACTALLAWSLTVHIPQKSSPSAATQRGVQYRTPRMRFPNPTPSVPRHSLGYSPHLERAIPILRDWLHPFPLPAFSCSGCKELVVVTHTHTHTHTLSLLHTHTHTHSFPTAYHVKVAQLCLTLYNPMDYTVRGILQARILEWVAVPFSRGSSQPRDQTQVSCVAGRVFTS